MEAVFADGVGREQTTDPRERPSAIGHREREEQLVGTRRVGDADLDRIEVRADEHRLDVMDRDVERGAHRAPLLDRGQDRYTFHPSAGRRAELRVQHRRDVLELAVLADDPALAVRLDGLAERLLAAASQLVAEVLPEVNELGQVLRPAACVRVRADGRHRYATQRSLELAAAVGQDLLAVRGPLADRDRHG